MPTNLGVATCSTISIHSRLLRNCARTFTSHRCQLHNIRPIAMASRSLGELLLRPSTSARIPQSSCPQSLRRTIPSWSAHRSISNSSSQSAQPRLKEEDKGLDSPQQRRQPSQRDTSAIDSLFSSMPTTRPAYVPRYQQTSSDEVRAARSNHVFGSRFSSAGNRSTRRPPGLNFDSMALPDEMLNPSLANKPSDAANLAVQQEETFANYPRLNPTYGRTVELDTARGRDIVRGIGMLGSLMARNKVKSDFNKQRFHERGGLKRKRLNSERWRARFKIGFREVVGRVSELTKKGW